MKKAFAAAATLMIICSSGSVFAALPPGVFTSQRPSVPVTSSHRIHVNPSHRMHTPTGNRVRMTPAQGQTGPVGGRMSSMPHGDRHRGTSSASVYADPPPGLRYDRVYVRPSLPPHHYYRPLPPPLWRYAGYYWRPYGGYIVAYPAGYYYGYPYYGRWGCYIRPGVRISVRL